MNISVFGGSQPKSGDAAYAEAQELGKLLAQRGHTVLTGGYIGTMEAVSRGASEAGGHVIGVTCVDIENWRKVGANRWVKEEWRKQTLIERLQALVEGCDAALALPGVPGTVGCYSLSLAGGYAVRQVDESVLPEGACLWSDGGIGALGICHAGALVFGGAKVRLLVYRVAADDEEGSVVLETDLERNPGSPPSGPPVCRESRTRRGRDGRILSPTAAAGEDRDVPFGEIVG